MGINYFSHHRKIFRQDTLNKPTKILIHGVKYLKVNVGTYTNKGVINLICGFFSVVFGFWFFLFVWSIFWFFLHSAFTYLLFSSKSHTKNKDHVTFSSTLTEALLNCLPWQIQTENFIFFLGKRVEWNYAFML